LNTDEMKLVKYTIVCIDRKHERILHTDERIVVDPMSHTNFAAWVIADYLQSEHISDEETKYLRVSFDVLDKCPRETFAYKERQVEVLEQIRDQLRRGWRFGTGRFSIARFE
jgi:hypothetical protein